ncbi:calcineurin-like phosphoesterase, partial [Achlya hypogyna]
SSFGNLVADALRSELGAGIGFVSGGFLRSNRVHAAKTTLTVGMLQADMPIQGRAVLTQIKVRHLVTALEEQLAAYPVLSGSYPHVSGVRVVYDCSLKQITAFTGEEGRPMDPDVAVTVATTQFIAGGGDGCGAWCHGTVLATHDVVAMEVARFVEKRRILSYPASEGRIRLLHRFVADASLGQDPQ